MNSVSLWWEFVSSMYNNHAILTLGVYGKKTTEARERTEDGGRTDGELPSWRRLAGLFRLMGMGIRNAERLCELCASVVNNCSFLIKLPS